LSFYLNENPQADSSQISADKADVFPFISRHLNPDVAAGGWSYLHFKCPSLHLREAGVSLSSIKLYI
jgi:hypothetical protein